MIATCQLHQCCFASNDLHMQNFQHADWLRARQLIQNSAESRIC